MATKYRQEGFSLIEMLVYIAILALMLMVIIQVVVSMVRSEHVIESMRAIENSASLSLERITRETRAADSINTAASTFNTHPGRLTLTSADRTVEFSLVGGRIRLTEDGVVSGYLTGGSTTVSSLIFRRFATSTVEGVRIEMTVESGTSTYYRTQSFYSSALIR